MPMGTNPPVTLASFDDVVPAHQTPALVSQGLLNQAGAVQNTWYTVLESTYVRLTALTIGCTVANETLEVRITVDGNVIIDAGGLAATAASNYSVYIRPNAASQANIIAYSAAGTYSPLVGAIAMIEGRSVKVELRKTSAVGASALVACCYWDRWT